MVRRDRRRAAGPGIARAWALAAALGALVLAARAGAALPLEEALAAAARSEEEARPAEALERYRDAVRAHPGERLTRRAEARIAWLEARAEGDMKPLAALLDARRRLSGAADAQALSEFAETVPAMPAGRVRRESYQLAGDAWLARLGRPDLALVAYRAWRSEPGIDDAERELAEAGLALALARLGRDGDALAGLDRAGLARRAEWRYLRAERVTALGSRLALAVLGLDAALLALAWRLGRTLGARTRSRAPVGGAELGLATLALAVPVVLVRLYDPQLVHAFAPAMCAAAGTLGVTWLAASRLVPPPRLVPWLSAASAGAVLAATWLAASQTGMLTELLMAAWEPR